jgi:hypothetical protein
MAKNEPNPSPDPVTKARRVFFVPFGDERLFDRLDNLRDSFPDPLGEIAETFRHNLSSVVATISVPLTIASSTVHHNHFLRLHMAERIRALPLFGDDDYDSDELSPEKENAARESALKKLEEFRTSRSGREQIARETCEYLCHVHESREMETAASELLRQGVILAWTTVEVVIRDVFVAYLNANPSAASRLIENPVARRRFEIKGLTIEVLKEHGYDVSRKMGDICLAKNDIGELTVIKDVYGALFPTNDALRKALDESALWILNQRRHLIVHRRAVVDAAYLKNTRDSLKIGDRLEVSPRELESYLLLVAKVGTEVLAAGALVDET